MFSAAGLDSGLEHRIGDWGVRGQGSHFGPVDLRLRGQGFELWNLQFRVRGSRSKISVPGQLGCGPRPKVETNATSPQCSLLSRTETTLCEYFWSQRVCC